MKYIETYKIDIGKNFYNDIKVKQNDTARYIRFEIFQNSIPFDLKGKNVRIYGIKPDKKILWNGCTLEDEKNGKILVPITSQMTAIPGNLKAELTIIEGDDILSSIPFEIKVIPCVRDDKAVESTNEFKDVFSTKITTVEVIDGVLQLTKDKYQIAEVPSGTEIRMPESIKADEYTNINLIINAKEDKFFVFDDIKWKEKPNLQAGYDYVISFTCINNIWYGEWLEYREFEKSYLYKNGDECTAVTGGWSFGNGWGSPCALKGEECIYLNKDRVSSGTGIHDYCYTNKKVNFSNYAKLYIDAKTSGMKVGDSITSNGMENEWVRGLSSPNARKIFEIDVSEKKDEYIFLIQCNNYDWVEIYKIWLE